MQSKNKKLKIPIMLPLRDNYYLYFVIAPTIINSWSCLLYLDPHLCPPTPLFK